MAEGTVTLERVAMDKATTVVIRGVSAFIMGCGRPLSLNALDRAANLLDVKEGGLPPGAGVLADRAIGHFLTRGVTDSTDPDEVLRNPFTGGIDYGDF